MTGTDAHVSAVIDNAVVLEDHFYSALKMAVIEGSQIESEAGGLKRDYTITVTDGVGTLPDTVLDECLDQSSIYSTTDDDIGELSSYQSRYGDYLRPNHDQLNYYAVQGTDFLFREAGADPGEYDGDIHLVAIGVPDVSSFTGAITISTTTAERTINILANLLKGA